MLAPLDVVLFDEIGALTAVEAGHYVEGLVVERDRRVEVAPRIQTGDLSPSVTTDVIYFTLVHGFAWQR